MEHQITYPCCLQAQPDSSEIGQKASLAPRVAVAVLLNVRSRVNDVVLVAVPEAVAVSETYLRLSTPSVPRGRGRVVLKCCPQTHPTTTAHAKKTRGQQQTTKSEGNQGISI